MTKPESPIPGVLDLEAMRDAIERVRTRLSPQDHVSLTDMIEVLVELRTIVSEADDDAPADETLLALAFERARARKSR